ncbi:MAG: hypothetical protein ACC609_13095 [Methanobacterium formicicum]
MKIGLYVNLSMKDGSWDLFFVEKEIELDFLPSTGDEIEDNGLNFEVENRKFNISKECVSIYLRDFKIENNDDKKNILNRMKKSGWYYRDPIVYDLSKL